MRATKTKIMSTKKIDKENTAMRTQYTKKYIERVPSKLTTTMMTEK